MTTSSRSSPGCASTEATGSSPIRRRRPNPPSPPLDANLKLYVEYSNEIWNYSINEEADAAENKRSVGDNFPVGRGYFDDDTQCWRALKEIAAER